jgi:hypothetical protein
VLYIYSASDYHGNRPSKNLYYTKAEVGAGHLLKTCSVDVVTDLLFTRLKYLEEIFSIRNTIMRILRQ